jgi:cellulose synthase/poly-beta-1,6-N-acetylglucosamine synthase-like glycosyltransferase
MVAGSKTPDVRRGHIPLHTADAQQATAPASPFRRHVGQLDRAVNDLRRRAPDLSAASPPPFWQCFTLYAAAALGSAGLVLLKGVGLSFFVLIFALAFLMVALVRVIAIWHALRRVWRSVVSRPFDRRYDDRLPTYSVLVPLYRERQVVPDLVQAMSRFDYPATLVEILFITEADDEMTRRALRRSGLRANMRIVTVPEGDPRTKPRALNYALQDARGTLVAVFDAEDIPDKGQLRRAADAFIEGGPRLACVQARLGIYNAQASFLSRQFALEYSALFNGLLPALDYFGLPIPLGGTSNHFRRDLLLKVGGWDPFNVTEDADLGIRLARLGYEVSIIDSVTMEEAPAAWGVWRGQRTRWIKGWIKTYLVHMRRPRRLWRDLRGWKFAGFQLTIGATILSMLVHPWFYVLAVWNELASGHLIPQDDVLWWICGSNLLTGYAAAGLLMAVTAVASGSPRSLISIVWLPVYWLMISYAAYRAIIDLIMRPFYWEKTAHGASVRTPARTRSNSRIARRRNRSRKASR